MDLLIIVENAVQYKVFHEAWSILETEANVSGQSLGSVYIKSVYYAQDNKLPFSRIYTADFLRKGKEKRHNRPVFDATIICGTVGPEDAQYLTYCMHQMLLGQVLIVDPNASQGSIPVFFAKHCKDLTYDSEGLAKDLFSFIRYVKMDEAIRKKHVS